MRREPRLDNPRHDKPLGGNGARMVDEPRGAAFDAAEQDAARRYLATVARRYVPVAVVAIFVLTVIAFVPSVRPIAAPGANTTASGGGLASGPAAAGATGA